MFPAGSRHVCVEDAVLLLMERKRQDMLKAPIERLSGLALWKCSVRCHSMIELLEYYGKAQNNLLVVVPHCIEVFS